MSERKKTMSQTRQKSAPPPPIGELTDTIHIDTSLIPDYVRDNLAAATLDLIHGILSNPAAKKRLFERLAAKKAANGATAPSRK